MSNGQHPGWQETLRTMTKSDDDRMIAGVCGGLGESTPLPSWLWRVIFIVGAFASGLGLIAYIAMWIAMPQHP